eukprot:1158045-Pelagomonas_calceolata.AAC.1
MSAKCWVPQQISWLLVAVLHSITICWPWNVQTLFWMRNTTARIQLNNHNPAWLQGLTTAVSEAK